MEQNIGCQNKWRLKKKENKVIRSQIGLNRIRCKELEALIDENIKILQKLKDSEIVSSTFNAYLKWIFEQMARYKSNIPTKKDVRVLEAHLIRFEIRFQELSHNQDWLAKYNSPNSKFKEQQIFDYYRFINDGLIAFSQVIDSHQIWLQPEDLKKVAYTKSPGLLSHVLIASLARFMLKSSDPFYNLIYGTNMKKGRKYLPHANENPSYYNVVALGFLSHLSMSHFDFNNVIRYFSMAVSMAQTLGYDKLEEYPVEKLEQSKQGGDVLRGKRVWQALYLTYLLLSSVYPSFPTFRFSVKNINLSYSKEVNLREKDAIQMMGEGRLLIARELFFSSPLGKNATDVLIDITSHIHKVKSEYSEFSEIPPRALRTPSETFNKIITTLMGYQISISSGKIAKYKKNIQFTTDNSTIGSKVEKFNFDDHSAAFIQTFYIILYYPSVLVFPQYVDLSEDEDMIIFHAANKIVERFKIINLNLEVHGIDPSSRYKEDWSDFLKLNGSFSLYYIQSPYPIYTYFNIISKYCLHSNEYYREVVETSRSNCLIVFKFLNWVKYFLKDDEFFSPDDILSQIHRTIDNYHLPNDFIRDILIFFNN